MAQGPNYNVILPFSTTNTIVPSTIVVGGLTVNGDISAQRFVALNDGSGLTPAFTFSGGGTNTGMFYNAATPGLAFAAQGTTVVVFESKLMAGITVVPAIRFLPSIYLSVDPTTTGRFAAFSSDATTPAPLAASHFAISPGTNNNGMIADTGITGFVFDVNGNPAILNTNSSDNYAATWDITTALYFCKPGVTNYATTTLTPSTTRSGAQYTNLLTAANSTLFLTLPTTIPGLEYTVSNAKVTGQTVVINPAVAGDTLNVFGLTKAAGASVAASAAFASITFHCITSTQWLATDIMGTWV